MSEKIESREKIKPVSFYVATHGLEPHLDTVLTDEEYNSMSPEDFPPNRTWEAVNVASEADKAEWLKLKDQWLTLAWEPNQSPEERSKNSKRMEELEEKMSLLEIEIGD